MHCVCVCVWQGGEDARVCSKVSDRARDKSDEDAVTPYSG